MTLRDWWRTMPPLVRLGFVALALGLSVLGVGLLVLLLMVATGGH